MAQGIPDTREEPTILVHQAVTEEQRWKQGTSDPRDTRTHNVGRAPRLRGSRRYKVLAQSYQEAAQVKETRNTL